MQTFSNCLSCEVQKKVPNELRVQIDAVGILAGLLGLSFFRQYCKNITYFKRFCPVVLSDYLHLSK